MLIKNIHYYSLILVLADFVTILAAFLIAYVLRVQFDSRPLLSEVYAIEYARSALIIAPIWIIVFFSLGLYTPHVYNKRLLEWSKIFIGTGMGILLVIGWQYVSGDVIFPARLVTAYAFAISFLMIMAERELLRFIRSLLYRFGIGVNRVLVIGNTPTTLDIARHLSDTKRSGYKIVALAGPKKNIPKGLDVRHYSLPEMALANIAKDRITAIIQTDFYEVQSRNERILNAAQNHHINYSFIPGEPEFYSGKNTINVLLGYPMITVYQTPLIGWGAIVKRLFDTIVVIITTPIWLSILLLVSIFQLILNPGPIFYKSNRLTKHGRVFQLYKFRSMRPREFDNLDPIDEFRAMGREDLAIQFEKGNFKLDNDPRITKFGSFLRNSSLDELPQIFNVLKGDISLVGPRPIPASELKAKFSQKRASLLLEVRSGLTGLWQVSGRSDLDTENRITLELYYVQNWSFWLDIKILFKTVSVVLFRKGSK